MKALGPVLAVIGILVGIFAVVNWKISKIIIGTHMSLYIGIIGLVLLVVGAGLAMMGRGLRRRRVARRLLAQPTTRGE